MKFRDVFAYVKKSLAGVLVLSTVLNLLGVVLVQNLLFPLTVESAEVTISTTPNTTASVHTKLGSNTVFISDLIGYKFFRYGSSPSNGMCGYSKTTDGGGTWGSFTPTDAQSDCIGISVWYDRWTPGNIAGNYIHIVSIDTSDDEMFYNRLDTSNDSLLVSTSISACSGCSGVYASTVNKPSITEATDGTIYINTDDGNGTNIRKCSSSCDSSSNWSSVGTPPQGNTNTYSLLLPLSGGEIMLINRSTTNVLRYVIWDGSSWSGFTTIDGGAVRNTTYDPSIVGTVDTDTGDLYLAYTADNDNFTTADHDIRSAYFDGSTWTTKTNIITNDSSRGILQVAIARDQNNGDIYVAYTARTTIGTANTGNVYTKRSQDKMSSWGSELGPYNASSGDIYGIDLNIMSFERIYASWFNASVGADIYGDTIADIGPEVSLTAVGAQISEIRAGNTNVQSGGVFALSALSSHTVSSFKLSESGTIDAQNSLKNIKLYYENDTSAPYDCSSESYSGSESQFGSTANAFSGANGTASFSNSPISFGPTSTLCLYVVYDVENNALNGQTIELSVNNPSIDISVSGGDTVFPQTVVALSSSTNIVSPDLTQYGYHFRLDNGNEATASSATLGTENTPLTALQVNTPRRLRIGVANQGSTSTISSAYKLEYGVASPTCSAINSWTTVDSYGADWVMNDSPHITDGDDTTNIAVSSGGLTDLASTSFKTINGALKDTTATSGSLAIGLDQFIEFEYSIKASSSASEGSTYCFRMTQGDEPLSVYDYYPEITISADVSVTAFGSQISTTTVASSSVYVGGGFSIVENSSSRSVTAVTISELGSISAGTSTANVKLFYENDTSAPYNCSSESYSGSESQYGTTAVNGFNLPGDKITFTDSVTITTTSALCLYVVLDVSGTAQNGDTLDVAIASPASDVVVSSGGTVGPSAEENIAGVTNISGETISQLAYHWRKDDGSETSATSYTAGMQNSPVTDFTLNSGIRVRFAVTNTSQVISQPTRFRLEYAPLVTTCALAPVWTDVGAVADGWDINDSTYLTDGENTTNLAEGNGGVSDGVGTFLSSNGGVSDTKSLSATTTLSSDDYVDLEYSIKSTALTAYNTTYCFRVSKNGTALDNYDNYAQITTTPKRDFKTQRGSAQITGTSLTINPGVLTYTAPASTSRAFVRITNTQMTGAGQNVGGGTQNADDVTAYISDASDLTTGFTLSRPATATSSTYVDWEIVEFIGNQDTDNEIIVRDVGTVDFTNSSLIATGTTVSGVADDSDVVVFITGSANQNTTRNYYASQVTSAWDSQVDAPVFTRAANGSAAVNVSYAVVEFVGVNWKIQRIEHTYATSGVAETEPITAVNSLAHTFIEAQKRVGASTNVVHYGHEVWLSSIGAISFMLESGATLGVEQTSVVWVIENTANGTGEMKVQRSAGYTTGGAEPLALSIVLPTPLESVSNTSIWGNSRSNGANTNYPRPMAGLLITSSSTYQIWRSDTGATLTYRVELVSWPVADLSIKQDYYRFYADNNLLKPSDPWPPGATDLGEKFSITVNDQPLGVSDVVRLRMALKVYNANMPAGFINYKLQYGLRSSTCSAISSGNWNDVGAYSSSTIWRGYNATGTTDGTALSTDPPNPSDLLISVSNVAGTLEHQNISTLNPYSALDGDQVEYDWYLQQNGANPLSTYCFRVVKSDGTLLSAYTDYPKIRTAGFTPVSKNWRWYSDVLSETPSNSLSLENVAPTNVDIDDKLALRISVREKLNVEGTNVKFKLQYSTDITFASSSDVIATTTCSDFSEWCYEIGGGVDNDLITTRLLSDAENCVASVGAGCGSHNFSPQSASLHVHHGGNTEEYSFVLRSNAPAYNKIYYFRLYDVINDVPVEIDNGEVYPSLVTSGTNLIFSVSGVPSGTSTAGVTTDVSSLPQSINFGTMDFNTEYIAAHRVTVTTNAVSGYEVLQYARQQLLDPEGIILPSIASTNNSPGSWTGSCQATSTGCIGYHSTDATLSGGSTRFAANDSYAGLETDPVEVMYSSVPASDTHDIVYRIKVSALQRAGNYETEIVYLAIPSF